MAWRKVHIGDEIWEWQTGKNVSEYILIRAPSRVVTKVFSSRIGAPRVPVADPEWEGRSYDYQVTPGIVKAYIEDRRETLMAKPEKHRKKGG